MNKYPTKGTTWCRGILVSRRLYERLEIGRIPGHGEQNARRQLYRPSLATHTIPGGFSRENLHCNCTSLKLVRLINSIVVFSPGANCILR